MNTSMNINHQTMRYCRKMKIQKLDRRMNGYDHFTHRVVFLDREIVDFIDIRNWCWQQWGASCEYDFWNRYGDRRNENWCWVSNNYNKLIYLGEKQLQWFLLKWQK